MVDTFSVGLLYPAHLVSTANIGLLCRIIFPKMLGERSLGSYGISFQSAGKGILPVWEGEETAPFWR